MLLLLLALGACSQPASEGADPQTESRVESPPRAYPELFTQLLEAHGGLDTWRSYRSLRFAWGDSVNPTYSVLDLQDRHEHIVSPQYELGYDGATYWGKKSPGYEGELNPVFFINLQFYFFGMPFVLADPGTQFEPLGKIQLGEKTYDGLKVTFGEGVGVAPKDQYLLHVDPETHRLELLLYSVTYFDEARAESYNARLYEEWQEVDGLWVPRTVRSYRWNAQEGSLGEARGTTSYLNVSFSEQIPSPAEFEVPEGAEVYVPQ